MLEMDGVISAFDSSIDRESGPHSKPKGCFWRRVHLAIALAAWAVDRGSELKSARSNPNENPHYRM
jgi:hypothetical protein